MSFAIRARLTPSSIRARLTLWYVAMVAGALAAFALFTFSTRAATLQREADDAVVELAERLVREMRPALLDLDVATALSQQARLDDEAVAVRERSGLPLFRSARFPDMDISGEAVAAKAARDGGGMVTLLDRAGRVYRIATVVVDRPGARSLAVQTAGPVEPVRRALGELGSTMAFCFAVVLALASYGGSFIARRALSPVDAIVARVRAIEASRLEQRLDLQTGSQELDGLVETLNGMLDRLEESMHGARRFAADASHELQTPIAAMRAALDVSLREGQSAADYQHIAADLVADVDRLSMLVRDLRLLAMADAGRLLERVETVDVAGLVNDCCEILRAVAEPRRISVAVDVLSSASVNGSELHLRRALLNVAQNAVRYSSDGATVQITVGRLDKEAVIAIVDEGCGIAAADLPHIFERFYRSDPARARDTGGTGLGLAIADQIVRSHSGRIEVSSEVGRGSSFLLFLPAIVSEPRIAPVPAPAG